VCISGTSEVVQAAVAGKRAQARGAEQLVLAALFTGGFGNYELEKFDSALFGRTVAHHDVDMVNTGKITFDPSGVFGRGHGKPTFAGALAFANLGWTGGPDPVLYMHPRFTGELPSALRHLRRRLLGPDGIVDVPRDREAGAGPPRLAETGRRGG
jgi:hypothetical protein